MRNLNNYKGASLIKAFKKKKFIDAKMADFITERVLEALGPDFRELAGRYNINMQDIIRFQIVAGMCCKKREEKGLTFKQIALDLKVPQYWLKDIENSRIKDIRVNILESYIDYLGLRRWFGTWKRHNLDVYKRLSQEEC